MMGVRNLSGLLVGRLPAGGPNHGPDQFLSTTGDENNLLQFDRIASRSAELCAAHGNGPNTSDVQGHNESKSGQRAASRCGTRTTMGVESGHTSRASLPEYPALAHQIPFQPIRPGLHAEPSGYVLRFVWASWRQVSPTAKGIGVYGTVQCVRGKES